MPVQNNALIFGVNVMQQKVLVAQKVSNFSKSFFFVANTNCISTLPANTIRNLGISHINIRIENLPMNDMDGVEVCQRFRCDKREA